MGFEKPEPGPDLIVGAVKKPDGTIDYSKSLYMKDPDGRFAEQRKKAEALKKQIEEKKFENPARPGTANRVWHRYKTAIDMAAGGKLELDPETVKIAKRAQKIFEEIQSQKLKQERLEKTGDANSTKADEYIRREMEESPAGNYLDDVMHQIIAYQTHREAGNQEGTLEGYGVCNINDLIRAAESLLFQLKTEASKAEK